MKHNTYAIAAAMTASVESANVVDNVPAADFNIEPAEAVTDFQDSHTQAVEPANLDEGDLVIEDPSDIGSDVKVEVDNIVDDLITETNKVEALAAISCEMHAVIADKGRLTTGEYLVMSNAVSAILGGQEQPIAMPSVESYANDGIQFANTQVSLESISESIARTVTNISLSIEKGFKNMVGLANSMTPIITSRLKSALMVRDQITSASRNEGEKTVKFKLANALKIEGRIPDPKTTVNTAKYLSGVTSELLSGKDVSEITGHLKKVQSILADNLDLSDVKRSSTVTKLLYFVSGIHPLPHSIATEVVSGAIHDKLTFSTEFMPSLFKLYPTVSKVKRSAGLGQFNAMGSLPLFGNTVVAVEDLKANLDLAIYQPTPPTVSLLSVEDGTKPVDEILTLTHGQQLEVIDAVIDILKTTAKYYGDFKVRNAALIELSKSAFEKQMGVYRNSKETGHSFEYRFIANAMNYYNRLYWKGIVGVQSTFAQYASTTCRNLTEYVKVSIGAVNSEGTTVSAESYSDFT